MNQVTGQPLRAVVHPFLARNTLVGLMLVCLDFSAAIGLGVLATIVEPLWQRLLFSGASGLVIGSLFVLGHDAAHGGLVRRRTLNAILARTAFLPSLHNATLWTIQHNRIHHQMPNVQGLNSWSPDDVNQYRSRSPARRALYRFYRSGLGTGLYYLVERWWKHKFAPVAQIDPKMRTAAWLDFAILLSWLGLWVVLVLGISSQVGRASPIEAIGFGVVIPFLFWNQAMGLTVLLQHTDPSVRWYRTQADAQADCGQEAKTVHVRVPRWYGFLTHDIMEHPAHHVNPAIPCYRLHAAQTRLNQVLGARAIVVGPFNILLTVRKCKLYDYESHRWLGYNGLETAITRSPRPS
jgi:acyl-lipid omega-6 desaturase (Delta-12 desaturase)